MLRLIMIVPITPYLWEGVEGGVGAHDDGQDAAFDHDLAGAEGLCHRLQRGGAGRVLQPGGERHRRQRFYIRGAWRRNIFK